jgi:hypothetical protein
MIKALFLLSPMIGMSLEDLPTDQLAKWEKDICLKEHLKAFYRLNSTDFDSQWIQKDVMLFPGRMLKQEACKLPKTCIMTSEYDSAARCARNFA